MKKAQTDRPNFFELKGKDTEITYSTSSLSGEPLFTFRSQGQEFSFRGDEIRRLTTEIGSLVTVTLEVVPDLRRVTLTLLVPVINLKGVGDQASFRTKAIQTTHRDSIGGPTLIKGAIQSYRVLALQGVAYGVAS